MLRILAVALCALAFDGPLEFEVASVRPIPPPMGPYNTKLEITPQGFNANFAALRQIAGVAYNIQRVRVEGGPGMMDSDLYAITAKAEKPDTSANGDQIREMLRTLLAERFKFAAHRETKQLPVYSLVVGKGGSKMQEVKDPGDPSVVFGALIAFRNMPVVGLVNYLANMLGSPVHDDTGLKGRYNFTLEFVRPGRTASAGESTPDIFEAVQEQLGLKLDGKKGPVEVLVVDHAEKASEN
jgi:uncharacterized protein (TIGR03435 family)